MRLHIDAGYLSAQSTPLVTREGETIGMVSTHWHEHHHRAAERELHFIDLLARLAADLIDQHRNEDALRQWIEYWLSPLLIRTSSLACHRLH